MEEIDWAATDAIGGQERLYIGGGFDTIAGQPAGCIASWDGTTLTSAVLPQTHVAYRTGSTCPSTHPVAIPELTEEVFWASDGLQHSYKISGADAAGIHAAFMNGWDQRALRKEVRRWLTRR